MAVADKYVIQMQTPANKFARPTETLAEFIEQYVAGVSAVMNHIIKQVQCCADDNECCPNFYYFHFLSQVRMYYPGAREKMEEIFRKEHELWKAVFFTSVSCFISPLSFAFCMTAFHSSCSLRNISSIFSRACPMSNRS